MDGRINKRGSQLFFDEITLAHAASKGFDDVFVLYAAGRAGVMGEVTAAQVTSAFAFFEPTMVEQIWAKAQAAAPAPAIAAIYAEGMSAAARERWNEDAASDVARIGRTVVDSVDPIGMPLFAGWRSMPVPDDLTGAAAIVVMALRELRGDVHVQSVAVSGLRAIEAEMATRGIPGAELHGWKPPYPDPEPLQETMAAAQAVTSSRMVHIYEQLDPVDLDRLDAAVAGLVKR